MPTFHLPKHSGTKIGVQAYFCRFIHISETGIRRGIIMAMSLLLIAAGCAPCLSAKTLTFGEPEIHIVLDPGHGGHDNGGTGALGTLEKNITLDIAKKIKIGCSTKYTIHLTRDGDYSVDIFERTAAANKIGADLFISIHTGGSFSRQTDGMTVYYHQPGNSKNGGNSSESVPDSANPDHVNYWRNLQTPFRQRSQSLAELTGRYLEEKTLSSKPGIQGMPALVLEGAAMPAILIEAGTLTNLVDEKMLKDPEFLSLIAAAVCKGIETYFEMHPDN